MALSLDKNCLSTLINIKPTFKVHKGNKHLYCNSYKLSSVIKKKGNILDIHLIELFF